MRIGVDARELVPGSNTGIRRFLTSFLSRARDRGHEWVLFGGRDTELSAFPWARHRRLKLPWPAADHWELPRLLTAERVDLFFSPYYKAPWRCPCPYVITIHDLMFLYLKSRSPLQPLRDRLELRAARHFAAGAAGILTVSEHSKRDILNALGAPADRVQVIPNAVPEGFGPVGPEARAESLQRLGVEPGYLLYVGGFKASKNPASLVKAFATLPEELRKRHPLVLAGPRGRDFTFFLARWRGALKRLGARVLPAVPDADLPALYSGASLCVVPSLYEGFGMPALEAMACGAPVLASNRTSLPEVVGDAGRLCPPHPGPLRAAIAELLADPAALERMRQAGLRRARDFDAEDLARRTLAYLEERVSA